MRVRDRGMSGRVQRLAPVVSFLLSVTFACGLLIAGAHVLNRRFIAPVYDVVANRLFAVEGVVRSARRWPGRGRGLPRMEVTIISGSKCSGSGWSPIGRFSGAGLSSPTDGVVAADARARPGTRWSGGWRTSRSGGGPRCWRSASADTGVTPPPTTGTRTDDAPRAVSRRRCRRSSRAGCPRGPRAGRSPGSRAGTPTATSAPCPAVRSRGCAGRRSRGSGRTPPGRRR